METARTVKVTFAITHHHKFINTPLINAEPFQTHRFKEVAKELDTDFNIRKAVNQRAEVLG